MKSKNKNSCAWLFSFDVKFVRSIHIVKYSNGLSFLFLYIIPLLAYTTTYISTHCWCIWGSSLDWDYYWYNCWEHSCTMYLFLHIYMHFFGSISVCTYMLLPLTWNPATMLWGSPGSCIKRLMWRRIKFPSQQPQLNSQGTASTNLQVMWVIYRSCQTNS